MGAWSFFFFFKSRQIQDETAEQDKSELLLEISAIAPSCAALISASQYKDCQNCSATSG